MNAIQGAGITYEDVKDLTLPKCITCLRAKFRRFNIKRNPLRPIKEYKPMEKLCSDIIYSRKKSINGNKYYNLTVCSATDFAMVEFMKSKSELAVTLNNIKLKYADPENHTIKYLQSDSDKGYTSGPVKLWCAKNNIQQRFSPPYVHQMNGKVERINGLIADNARAFMLAYDCPEWLWEPAVETAVYMYNRSLSSSHRLKTPHELMFDSKPDISKVVPFYCPGVCGVPPDLRTKWEEKGIKCRMLGYAEGYQDTYKVLTKNNKILHRHDCIWLEDEPASIHHVNITKELNDIPPIPRSLYEALNGSWKEQWIEAAQKEFKEIFDRQTFKFAKPDKSAKAVRSKLVFRITIESDGNLKFKVRWVACGYSQRYGSDYIHTFAPTANFKSICIIIHIGATNKYIVCTLDIGNAYLESLIDIPIRMLIPKDILDFLGLDESQSEVILQKSLYGLKQAGNLWNKKLHSIIISFGCKQSIFDPCIYIYSDGESILYVGIYVDDIIMVCSNHEIKEKFINHLKANVIKLKITENQIKFLGMNITKDISNNQILLDQSDYTKSIIKTQFPTYPNLKPSLVPISPTSNIQLAPKGTEKPELTYAAAINPTTFINVSINICEFTITITFVIFIFSFEYISIRVSINSVTIIFTIYKFAFEYISVRVLIYSFTMKTTIFKVTLISVSIRKS